MEWTAKSMRQYANHPIILADLFARGALTMLVINYQEGWQVLLRDSGGACTRSAKQAPSVVRKRQLLTAAGIFKKIETTSESFSDRLTVGEEGLLRT